MKELKYVGKETVRLLGPQIVTGKAKYTGDFKLPGMQYGKILRSPHPYAKILSIDVEKAKAYPGVSAVVTWKDVDRNIYITNGFTPPKHHHKAKCLYKYDAEKDEEKNKVMKINEQWETLKEESHANIQSEKGILNRQIRSIQTEGHFGDIKGNDNFRRFNYRTAEKVYKEFMLYAMGRNINKYHRFLHDKIQKFEGKNEEKAA